MSFWDKVGDWSYRHQYTLIMGGWATSLGVAGAIISRNKCVEVFYSVAFFWLKAGRLKVSDISSKNCPSPYVGTRIDNRSPYRRRCPHAFKEEVGERGGKASLTLSIVRIKY